MITTHKTQPETRTFTWEGGDLFYRHWAPAEPSSRVVFLFHRGHEHSGRMSEVAAGMPEDVHVVAWDARGHGRSPGRRGFAPNGFASMVDDMDAFVRGICIELDIHLRDAVIVAHSVAAVVAATWIHDRNPGVRAAVLATPAFRVRLYIPFALPGLRVVDRLKPEATISSYVKGKLLTHDSDQAAAYDDDELISKNISNRVLVGMSAAAKRVVDDAAAITTPVLMIQAGADWVVDNRVQDRFFKNLGSYCKQRLDIADAYHAVFHELDRADTIGAVAGFISERFALEQQTAPSRPGNAAVHARLQQDLSPLSPRRLAFALTRAAMRGPGRLSHGIRTGWRHGFDSGVMLDHVYDNRPSGSTPVGRAIDRVYLDSIGWRGIRMRKEHLESVLREAIDQHLRAAGHAHVADIAGGPGRYLQDALIAAADDRIAIRCRDRDPVGLADGRALAAERGLSSISYEAGDAFDPASIAELGDWAQVIIASGIYELFADNELISRSLDAIAAALPVGGHLIYTNQPWHPQLEFIARVLVNRDQDPWVMRCRPQAEIDALVATAGFVKQRTLSDPWGIFTVSVAVKVAAGNDD